MFNYVLNFLRDKKNELPKFENPDHQDMFYSELDFWGISYEKAKGEDKDKEFENIDDFINRKK